MKKSRKLVKKGSKKAKSAKQMIQWKKVQEMGRRVREKATAGGRRIKSIAKSTGRGLKGLSPAAKKGTAALGAATLGVGMLAGRATKSSQKNVGATSAKRKTGKK